MNDLTMKYEAYPELKRLVDLISAKNPLQRKRIDISVKYQNADYWAYAAELIQTLDHSFLRDDKEWDEAAQSYNRMCMDFLREQIRFRKTGVYSMKDADKAHQDVYNQPHVMRYYMVGLLLSYLFWPNHYEMLCFYRKHLQQISFEHYLEIAPGHGLFTVEAIRHSPDLKATLVDISATSLQVTRDLLTAFHIDSNRIQFIHGDFMGESLQDNEYDFISMGEVLEHVDDAPEMMKRAYRLLRSGGSIFMTTCANCPSIDHVYHFHTVDEIRKMIRDAGLSIMSEIALPAEDISEDKWQEELVTINYAAILTKE